MAVSIGDRPARAKVTPVSTDPPHRPAKATPVSRERFPMPAGGGRARLRYPWAAARPGRATSGRPTLQTSSNQHDSHRLARTSVTNVVNLSPKTSIFTEKADGLTTFVTTRTEPHVSTPGPTGVEGAGGICRGAGGRRRGRAGLRDNAPSNISDQAPLV